MSLSKKTQEKFNLEGLNKLHRKLIEKGVRPLNECVYVIPRPFYDALVEAGEVPDNIIVEEYKNEI